MSVKTRALHNASVAHSPAGPPKAINMTLRDYFAGQAMVALSVWAYDAKLPTDDVDGLPERCYALADAMLLARDGADRDDRRATAAPNEHD